MRGEISEEKRWGGKGSIKCVCDGKGGSDQRVLPLYIEVELRNEGDETGRDKMRIRRQ